MVFVRGNLACSVRVLAHRECRVRREIIFYTHLEVEIYALFSGEQIDRVNHAALRSFHIKRKVGTLQKAIGGSARKGLADIDTSN